jgi:hypothetical protein
MNCKRKTALLAGLVLLTLASPSAAQEAKPKFLGQWKTAKPCSRFPQALSVTIADGKHIVINGADYPVRTDYGPHALVAPDRDDFIITWAYNFITPASTELIIQIKGPDGIKEDCAYARDPLFGP